MLICSVLVFSLESFLLCESAAVLPPSSEEDMLGVSSSVADGYPIAFLRRVWLQSVFRRRGQQDEFFHGLLSLRLLGATRQKDKSQDFFGLIRGTDSKSFGHDTRCWEQQEASKL